MGRRCKRDQNLAPQNARRGRLKDPTRTTKNGPNTTATLTRTPLRLLRRARASEKPAPAESFKTTRRVGLYVVAQKTSFDRRPDVLAPGSRTNMFTETTGNRYRGLPRTNETSSSCGPKKTDYRLD